ncbi:MAG: DUF3048 domain-containing protein [Candidatus Saccharimonadales bacterium]
MQNDISLPPRGPAPEELPVDTAVAPPSQTTSVPAKPPITKLLTAHRGWSGRKKLLVGGAVLIVLAGTASALLWWKTGSGPISTFSHKNTTKPAEPILSPLTGVEVPAELAKRPVTAIMVENSLAARPQSGLRSAGIVFEAIAEGGITRFLVLFQESDPKYVGPVRSLRPYYIDWAVPFDAGIAHVGGSPQALKQIRKKGMKDLDQFFNPGSYWRVSSRSSPHNVYTSFDKLDKLNKSKGFKTSNFTSWPRKKDAKIATPTASTIDFSISSALYNVRYSYDAKSNSYYRRMGGEKHTATIKERDLKPKQLHPKVIIALVMDYGLASDGHHSTYDTAGGGKAYIFQDGGVTVGVWKKKSRESQFRFLTTENQPISLNAGQAWVTIVGDKRKISYKP